MADRRFAAPCVLRYAALVLVAAMPTQVGVPVLKLHRATVALTVADILIWVLAAVLVARWMVSRGRQRLAWPPLHIWLVAAVAGLSGAAWLDPSAPRTELLAAIKEMIQYAGIFVAAPLVFLNLLEDTATRARAVWVWAVVTGAVILLGATQAYLEAAGAAPEWLSATRHRELAPLDLDPRNVVGLFGSRTVYGVYLALSLPVLLGLSMSVGNMAARALMSIVIVLGAASITAPGPFLALAVGLTVTGAASGDTPRGRVTLAAAGMAFALCGLAFGPFRGEKLAWTMTETQELTEVVWDTSPTVAPLPAEDGFAPAPPDDELELAPGEADAGFAPAPPDEQLELAPGEAEDGFAPAPPDDELELAPGEAEDGFAPAPRDEELELAPGEADTEPGTTLEAAEPRVVVVGEQTVLSGRMAEWGAAIDMLGSRQRPIAAIGAGPGQYQSDVGGYFGVLPKGGKLEPDFQNQYLVIATELGLSGLFAFVLMLWISIVGARKALTELADGLPDIASGLLGSMAALVVANLFGSTLVRGTSVTIALVVSLIVVYGKTARR